MPILDETPTKPFVRLTGKKKDHTIHILSKINAGGTPFNATTSGSTAFDQVSETIGGNSGLLPPGVRYVDNQCIIVERRPGIYNMAYRTSPAGSGPLLRGDVAMPWQIIVIAHTEFTRINNIALGWRNLQATGLDSPVYVPLLGNIYAELNVCLPKKLNYKGGTLTVGQVVDKALQAIYEGVTNADIRISYEYIQQMNRLKTKYGDKYAQVLNKVSFKDSAHLVVPTLNLSISDVLHQLYPTPVGGLTPDRSLIPQKLDADGLPWRPHITIQDLVNYFTMSSDYRGRGYTSQQPQQIPFVRKVIRNVRWS